MNDGLTDKILVWRAMPAGLEKLEFNTEGRPESLDQASALIPTGAYTTFRTYHKTTALHFSAHIARLEETARLTRQAFRLDKDQLRANIRLALSRAPWKECRVRITLDTASGGGVYYLSLEELIVPTAAQYENGVSVGMIRARRDNPKAKLSTFLEIANSYRAQSQGSNYECLMVSEKDEILEGLSSNFFSVNKGVLQTAGEGVLEGITRTYVLEIAEKMGLPVELKAARLADLSVMAEAFLTSSSRGILPIIVIDGTAIGDGKPGPVTKALRRDFDRKLAENLEEI